MKSPCLGVFETRLSKPAANPFKRFSLGQEFGLETTLRSLLTWVTLGPPMLALVELGCCLCTHVERCRLWFLGMFVLLQWHHLAQPDKDTLVQCSREAWLS